MRRRNLIAMLGGAVVAWSGATRAAAAVPYAAFLAVGFGADTAAFDAIRDALRRLGEVEGRTYVPDMHASDNVALLPQMAAEIVAAQPAVIVTINATGALELLKLTQTIPIVVAFSGDPVALGFTQSVARPSRNVTGILTLEEMLFSKKLELLGRLVGPMRRAGVIHQLGYPAHDLVLSAAKKREDPAGPALVLLGVTSGPDLAHVLDRGEARDLDGLIVLASPMIVTYRADLIAAEISRRLAAVHTFLFEAQDGALAAYGPEPTENFERAAEYADRLLHGAKISDLPFDSPRKIRFSLNTRTARALGLAIPPMLLTIADDVIE